MCAISSLKSSRPLSHLLMSSCRNIVAYFQVIATTLSLEVFTQRNFVADFFDKSWILLAKTAKLRFVPPFGGFRGNANTRFIYGLLLESVWSAVHFLLVLIELF